jgi:hypothetical protein
MSLPSQFLVYLTAFRLAVLAAGVTSIVLGYWLFVRSDMFGFRYKTYFPADTSPCYVIISIIASRAGKQPV